MKKADLINRIVKATPLRRRDARATVDALFEGLGAALVRGQRVVLRRFVVFHTGRRKTGVARNPRTGEPRRHSARTSGALPPLGEFFRSLTG